MSGHARLSPSAAHRWMNCPGSVALEATLPGPGASSSYAEEGTAAHALAANCLLGGFDASHPQATAGIPDHLMQYVDEDMQIHVQTYIDRVREIARGLVDPVILIEQRYSYSDYVPDGSGTADVVIIGTLKPDEVLVGWVIDLKYGQGLRVVAPGNEQLRLYALGADQELSFLYPVNAWGLMILQPRLDHESHTTITPEELRKWGEEVRAAAVAVDQPDAPLVPSVKACQWCKAKAICKARAEQALAVAQTEFEVIATQAPTLPDPKTLTIEQLGAVLPRLEILTDWAAAVSQHALQLALDGQPVPGHKLVEGRSNRQWVATDAVVERLTHSGIAKALLFKPGPLIGIPEAEKLLKTIHRDPAEVLQGIVSKPPGKPALVPESDPRPPITRTTAADDFNQPLDPWEM